MITLTKAAVQHIKNMVMKEATAIGFRLSLKKTGCSGQAYHPEIISQALATDVHFMQDGLAVFVDPLSEKFLKGTIVDYVEEEAAAGIKQKRLIYINPNEKNHCGCGESFTID